MEKRIKIVQTLRFYENSYEATVRLIRSAPDEATKGALFETARHYKNMINKLRKDLEK